MSKSLTVAISVGILAGLWTFLSSSSYLAAYTNVAVGFIAWACSGLAGKTDAMQKTVIGMTFGAVIAVVATMLGGIDLPVIGANIAVGVGIAALILVLIAGKVSQVSNVGINVLGFASAFAIGTSNAGAIDLSNPVVIVLASSILGCVAGMLADKLSSAMK